LGSGENPGGGRVRSAAETRIDELRILVIEMNKMPPPVMSKAATTASNVLPAGDRKKRTSAAFFGIRIRRWVFFFAGGASAVFIVSG